MLNLIVNIIFGYGLETIYFGYAFNKIKGISNKKTYLIYFISYILGAIIIQFTFKNIYYGYIITSFLFEIINFILNKQKFDITNVFLILNLLLINSILLAIPILFIGYNNLYLFINIVLTIILFLLIKILPFNKYYKLIRDNWNRTTHNKIKSVTVRNFTMIIIYTLVTVINMFVNEIFINIYQKLL